MDIDQIKKIIADKFEFKKFKSLIQSNGDEYYVKDFLDSTGLKFKHLNSERTIGSGDYDGWVYRFEIEDKIYEVNGYYSSYEGADLDDPMDFYEVKLVKKVIEVYEKV